MTRLGQAWMFHVINMSENRMTGCFHCQTHTPRTDNVCLRSIPEFHLGMLCSREMACHLRNKSINSRALCPEFNIYPRGQMDTAKTTWKDAQPCSNPANRNQNYSRENCPALKKVSYHVAWQFHMGPGPTPKEWKAGIQTDSCTLVSIMA